MRLKRVIFVVVVILLLIIIGVFLWNKYKRPDIPYVLSKEYTITETEQEKIIEYKETGFEIRIPKDWDIGDDSGIRLVFTSPDFQLHERVGPYNSPIPERGCIVSMDIIKEGSAGTEYDYVNQVLEVCPNIGQDCNEYKIIEINKNKGLEYVYLSEDDFIPGKYVWIRIPKKEKLYNFESWPFSQDREKCEQEFNKILETVEIRK
jgi:hypothetical protein